MSIEIQIIWRDKRPHKGKKQMPNSVQHTTPWGSTGHQQIGTETLIQWYMNDEKNRKSNTFNRVIQQATSSAWAASSIITRSNVVDSSLREDAPVKVVRMTSAFFMTSVTANCCLFRSSLARVLSSFLMSLFMFLSFDFRSFPFRT